MTLSDELFSALNCILDAITTYDYVVPHKNEVVEILANIKYLMLILDNPDKEVVISYFNDLIDMSETQFELARTGKDPFEVKANFILQPKIENEKEESIYDLLKKSHTILERFDLALKKHNDKN